MDSLGLGDTVRVCGICPDQLLYNIYLEANGYARLDSWIPAEEKKQRMFTVILLFPV